MLWPARLLFRVQGEKNNLSSKKNLKQFIIKKLPLQKNSEGSFIKQPHKKLYKIIQGTGEGEKSKDMAL